MELNLKKTNKNMSHVRRKPSRHPRRVVRRKNKRPWLAYFVIILLFLSLIVGIILVIIAAP